MASFKDVHKTNWSEAKLKGDQEPENADYYTNTHVKTVKENNAQK